jgi:hypothetical protein
MEEKKKIYQFQSPLHSTVELYKNDNECGFDVLGFRLQGSTDLKIFKHFSESIKAYWQLLKLNPAIQYAYKEFKTKHNNSKKKH